MQAEDFGDTSDMALRPESPTTVEAFAASTPVSAPTAGIPADLQTYLDEQERQVLLKALKETDFNRTAAAARLGLNLRQMRYRIQRLGITTPADGDDET
jgi:two-component system response regulator PilR (NtrC family)